MRIFSNQGFAQPNSRTRYFTMLYSLACANVSSGYYVLYIQTYTALLQSVAGTKTVE